MTTKQYKQLICHDLDPIDGCEFQIIAETEEEIIKLTTEHERDFHSLCYFHPDRKEKVKSLIKTFFKTLQ